MRFERNIKDNHMSPQAQSPVEKLRSHSAGNRGKEETEK
jgi:hypothetical protein